MQESGKKTFLGLNEDENGPYDIVILPIPYEITTSYREGTEFGPEACIDASSQVELYDEMLDDDLPSGFKIFTSEPWDNDVSSLKEALLSIEKYSTEWVNGNQFPIFLGGEHGMLLPIVRSLRKHPKISGKLENLTVIQIDAHADLRDELNGEKFSHASAIRRCLDHKNISLISFGIRNISESEIPFLKKNKSRINIFWAKDKSKWDLRKFKKLIKNKTVYLTFDVDGFDSSIMPATGTPEPGGLLWDETLNIIKIAAKNSNIVGADINELAPIKGFNSYNFLVAKLAYKILSYKFLI